MNARLTFVVATTVAVCWSLVTAAKAREKSTFIDLQPYQNRKLDDNQGRGFAGNTLAELPRGARTLAGIRFQIGPGLIQLGSQVLKSHPASMEGIKVKEQFSKLHILHATCFGGGPNEPGDKWHIDDGAELGHYIVHYEDQSTERIPIVYGEDVCDWFYVDGEKEPTRALVAWHGDNEFAKSVGCHLRIYASTWSNPKPEQRVMRIDFVGRKDDTPGALMCLAMTAVEETDDITAEEAKAKAREEVQERASRAEQALEQARRRGRGAAELPPFRDGTVPRNWQRFDFNGHTYYVVPL